jgi:hypothetical protein
MDDAAYNIAKAAKLAFQESRLVSASERNAALQEIRRELEASKAEIFAANGKDLEVSTQVSSSRAVPFFSEVQAAQEEFDAERMSTSMLKRLDICRADKWELMLQGVSDVEALPDPTGIVSYASELDDGLRLYRVSCPIGVLLVIFESRPEVIVNLAALAVKSGELSQTYRLVFTLQSTFHRKRCDFKRGKRSQSDYSAALQCHQPCIVENLSSGVVRANHTNSGRSHILTGIRSIYRSGHTTGKQVPRERDTK